MLFVMLFVSVVSFTLADQAHLNQQSIWEFRRTPPVKPICKAKVDDTKCTVKYTLTKSATGKCRSDCFSDELQVTNYLGETEHPCEGDPDGCACCVKMSDITTKKVPCQQICTRECYESSSSADAKCADECLKTQKQVGKFLCLNTKEYKCQCCKGHKPNVKKRGKNVHGDPQFLNFDGTHFKYDGHDGCEYVFFQECVHHPSFFVLIRHHYLGEINKMMVSEVSVSLQGIDITFFRKNIFVNGKIEQFPFVHGNLTVNKMEGGHVKVYLESKFSLTWNGRGRVVPVLEQSMFGKVCGLMGNGDGNPDNDMQMPMPDGTLKQTNDTDVFGDSWVVPGSCN